MTIDSIPLLLSRRSEYPIIRKTLSKSGARLHLRNLRGAAPAALMAALARDEEWSRPVMCVAQDEDAAGYLHNDLTALLPKEYGDEVLFLPSLYRRGIRYGQVDIANEVLRTQIVDRLRSDRQPRFIVSYPDALMEVIAEEGAGETGSRRLVIRPGVS